MENRFRDLMALCAARTRNPLGSFAPPTLLFVEPGRALSLRTLERWSPNLTRAEVAANPAATNMTWALLGRELADRSGMFSEARTLLHEPRVEAELDYSMGFNLLLPHLGPLKSLGQDLNTCALYEMRRGKKTTDPRKTDPNQPDVRRAEAGSGAKNQDIGQLFGKLFKR